MHSTFTLLQAKQQKGLNTLLLFALSDTTCCSFLQEHFASAAVLSICDARKLALAPTPLTLRLIACRLQVRL